MINEKTIYYFYSESICFFHSSLVKQVLKLQAESIGYFKTVRISKIDRLFLQLKKSFVGFRKYRIELRKLRLVCNTYLMYTTIL